MAKEHVKTWTIGKVKVSRIVELWDFQDDIRMTMPDATEEEVIAMRWLHPHYATPDGRQRMNFQGFVVETPDKVIVVDSCIGAGRKRDFEVFCDLPEGFIEDLASLGITREQVDTVMCTHLHFDHVGWNTYKDPATGEYRPTFPNARYLFGAKEYAAWQEVLRHDGVHSDTHLVECVDPIVAAGMADFIAAGHFANHVRRCREAYAERERVLAEALRGECAGMFAGEPASAGMHLCARFKHRIDDNAVAAAARDAGLIVEPLSRFYGGSAEHTGLVLGFAGFRPETLREAAKRLGQVLQKFATAGRAAAG